MIEKIETHNNKISFLLAWLFANSIGLGIGWAAGEVFGSKAAKSFGWILGQLAGFISCEGLIWLARGTILSRLKMVKILTTFEIFFWILGEAFGWLVASLSTPDKASLINITSATILAYFWGTFGWLIIWLVKVEAQRRRLKYTFPRNVVGVVSRVGGSILILMLFMITIPLSITLGDTIAKMSNLIIGRAVAGLSLGALIGGITGLAMISLQKWPAWE